MEKIIITTESELRQIIKDVLAEIQNDYLQKIENEKTYTINGVAKRLKMAHNTIKKYVANGLIQTTKSGRISEGELQSYLKNPKFNSSQKFFERLARQKS